jgi:hypothetical protein
MHNDWTDREDQFEEWLTAYRDAGTGASAATPPEPTDPELGPRVAGAKAVLSLLDRVHRKKPAGAFWPLGPIDRFEVKEELGRGGFGVVLRAADPRLGRDVALKVPYPHTLTDPVWRQRFLGEAETAAGLAHPNIVPVLEAGEAGGQLLYIVMELCRGPSLATWLAARAEPAPPHQAAELLLVLTEALRYVHSRGVIHRDLKPHNVLLVPPDGGDPTRFALGHYVPKLTDFGLAKVLQRKDGATRTGDVLGTAKYMAPEQVVGKPSDIGWHTDVYGLGATLYELLTHRAPFEGESVLETLEQVVGGEPVPLRSLNPRVPRDLETICLKCLRKQPGQRYGGAADLAEELRRFLAGEPIRARPAGWAERAWRWSRRNPGILSLATGVFLALALAAGGFWFWALSEKKANDFAQEALRREREITDYLDHSADLTFALVDEQFGQFSLQLEKGAGMTEVGAENFETAVRDLDPLYDPLERLDPGNARRAFRFGRVRVAMGDHLTLNRKKPQDALAWFERGVPLLEMALQAEPHNEVYRRYCGRGHAGWAIALDRLQRDAECLPHRERAVELADEDKRKRERLFRAQTLARLGQHARATREAQDLAAAGRILPRPGTSYNLAIIWAVAVTKVDQAKDVAPAQRAELKELYAHRAVEMLRREEIAYFQGPRNWAEFVKEKEDDFALLRGRPDFEAFCREIEMKIKP